MRKQAIIFLRRSDLSYLTSSLLVTGVHVPYTHCWCPAISVIDQDAAFRLAFMQMHRIVLPAL